MKRISSSLASLVTALIAQRYFLAVLAFAIALPDVAARAQRGDGTACLTKLRGSPSVTESGKIRFAFHYGSERTSSDPVDTAIDVDPRETEPEMACISDRSPQGLIQTGRVPVWIDGGPVDRGRDPSIQPAGRKFGITFAYVRTNVLPWTVDYGLSSGSWLDRGHVFGLQRYQQVVGIINHKIMPDASFLGAYYVGKTAKNRLLLISCVDFDPSKDVGCELQVQLVPKVMMTILVPTENLSKWREYGDAGEQYFDSHIEN
jgi:hypothetical protein